MLSNETTKLLHGEQAAKKSQLTAEKIFMEKSIGEALPIFKIKKDLLASGINVLEFVVMTPLANSKGEIRRMIKNSGLRINNEIVTDDTKIINESNFDDKNSMKVSHGKKQHVIVKII